MEEGGIAKSVRPQGNMHRGWQTMSHVQQLFSGAFGKVLDRALGYPILEVGIDPAEGESLLFLLTRQLESIVCKPAVVAMVVLDDDTVFGGKAFECQFSSDRFIRGQILHEMNKPKNGPQRRTRCGNV